MERGEDRSADKIAPRGEVEAVGLLTSLVTSKVGHQIMAWLGIAVHLGSGPANKGCIARIERAPTINRILDDLGAEEVPRAA